MAQYDVVWTAPLGSTAAATAVGTALVKNTSTGFYVAATTSNRASYGRTHGIAITAGDATNPAVVVQVSGVITKDLTGLATGTASWVRISSTATLERCTPSSGDDVVGKCNTNGDVFFQPGTWDSANYAGGGGSFSAPTGTGPMKVSGGALVSAASKIDLADATNDITGTLAIGHGGTGQTSFSAGAIISDGSALSSVAPGDADNVLTSNGTTWVSSAPAAGDSEDPAGTFSTDGSSSPANTINLITLTDGQSAAIDGIVQVNYGASGARKAERFKLSVVAVRDDGNESPISISTLEFDGVSANTVGQNCDAYIDSNGTNTITLVVDDNGGGADYSWEYGFRVHTCEHV